MPLDIPITPILTDTQAQLTSVIGSMKSLLVLPGAKNFNIPKDKQISLFDYLLKVMQAIGLSPETVFNLFIGTVFDATSSFLEEKLITAISHSLATGGVQLSPYIDNPNASEEQKKQFEANNKTYLNSIFPTFFLQTVKQQLIKDFMIMLFGPTQGGSTSILNPNTTETIYFVNSAVCAEGIFSVSSDAFQKEEDVEYNKIKLRQELAKGKVTFEISCQNVQVSLPADPGYFFTGGGQFTQNINTPPTPTQTISLLVQYVNNQIQSINNEANANSGGKSFFQLLIEKLISYIGPLLFNALPAIFSIINQSTNQNINYTNYIASSCDLANDTSPSNSQQKKQKKSFISILANALLRELLKIMLIYVIKEFKKLVARYFAKRAIERQRRKLEKARMKSKLFQTTQNINEQITRAQKYKLYLELLSGIINAGNV